MKGLSELVSSIPVRKKRINVDKLTDIEERFVVITHEDSQRVIHTKFTYSQAHFPRFVQVLDTLHDRNCKVVKSDVEQFEDYPDIFSDEKLEICIDEEFGEYSNKV